METLKVKAILRKKNEAGGIRLTGFRLYGKATVIKTLRSMEQKDPWNRSIQKTERSMEHTHASYTKINSRWLKDLNMTCCLKTPRREHTKYSLVHKMYRYFLRSVSQTMEIKAKLNKWNLFKHELFHSKENHKQSEKTTYRLGEKYLQVMQPTRA